VNANDKKLLAQLSRSPGEFIGRLKIVDEKGQVVSGIIIGLYLRC
jgi:hypothetical protein